jgi:hypothetical protein
MGNPTLELRITVSDLADHIVGRLIFDPLMELPRLALVLMDGSIIDMYKV